MFDSPSPHEASRPRLASCRFLAGVFLTLLPLASATAQEPTFVRDVRLEPEGASHSLVLENGRIVGVLEEDAPAPPGARIVDGAGRLCLPAFVDAFATAGLVAPEPETDQDRPKDVSSDVRIEMREANRKGVRATFRAATGLDLSEPSAAWRKAGFALAVVSPSGELLAGDGCLVTTRDAAARDVVVDAEPWGHAAFRASGSGYPGTLMGYITQLRQLFLDAERHSLLVERQRTDRPGERPAWDPELEAASRYLGGAKRLVCEAETSRDIERWLRIADEFDLAIAISGGRDAWRVADQLARRKIPVLLTLDWGDEVDDPDEGKDEEKDEAESKSDEEESDSEAEPEEKPKRGKGARGKKGKGGKKGKLDEKWVYEEPLEVRRERRRLWEENRDNALRLHEAGVRFAFGTGGDKPTELIGHARALVEAGLPRDVALRALTTEPKELLGRTTSSIRIERGQAAHLVLWTDDPLLEKDAKAAWILVEGHAIDLEVPVEEEDEDEEEDGDDRR